MNTQLREKVEAYCASVEQAIDTLVPSETSQPAILHQAMRYSLQAGGKRLRPILLLAASELFPHSRDPLPAAVAIECLHTYTLIHDDLPALDNSPLRRGRPSLHTKFSESTAILAGDGLLTLAFEILTEAYQHTPDLALRLTAELATRSGSRQLIGGQFEDIANEGIAPSPETLSYIHRYKTGALLTAALKMGLYFSNPSAADLEKIEALGSEVGLLFQIVDDLLDATSSAETMGKPVGADSSAQKATYVSLYGIEGARAKAQEHAAQAKVELGKLSSEAETLFGLVDYLANRAS